MRTHQDHASARELALTGVTAGRLRSLVIDRCFVDDTGTRSVIDCARCRRRRCARRTQKPPAPSTQNDRNAPTLKLVLLFVLPLCASAFTSVTSASSVRFLVNESYTPPVTLRFLDTRVGSSAALARSSLLSP